ncbi:hypothetical protein VCV18_004234 [Metarhizium anisopliae]
MSVVGLLDVWHVHRPIVFLRFVWGCGHAECGEKGQEIQAVSRQGKPKDLYHQRLILDETSYYSKPSLRLPHPERTIGPPGHDNGRVITLRVQHGRASHDLVSEIEPLPPLCAVKHLEPDHVVRAERRQHDPLHALVGGAAGKDVDAVGAPADGLGAARGVAAEARPRLHARGPGRAVVVLVVDGVVGAAHEEVGPGAGVSPRHGGDVALHVAAARHPVAPAAAVPLAVALAVLAPDEEVDVFLGARHRRHVSRQLAPEVLEGLACGMPRAVRLPLVPVTQAAVAAHTG